jgi:hypothetical protein
MADLIKQDRRIITFGFIVPLFALILAIEYYERVDLEQMVAEATPEVTEGIVTNLESYNSFIEFMVKGKLFRSEQHTLPCLDITNEIEINRVVKLKHVYISVWPGSKASANCILSATYLTDKKGRRSGRSKINT